DKITVNGKFFEPCLRTLVLELHEKNKVDSRVTLEFGIDSSYPSVEYIDSENIIFQFPYTQLKDLDYSVEWEISIFESGKREQASWATSLPTVIDIIPDQPGDDESGGKSKKIDIKLILSIAIPVGVFLIAVIIIFIIVIACFKYNDKKHSDLHHKKNEDIRMEYEISSMAENEKNESDRYVQRREIAYKVDKSSSDSDGDYIYIQEVIYQQTSPQREKSDIRKNPVERVDASITTEDQQIPKDKLSKKIQTQIQQKKDTKKSSRKNSRENKRSDQLSVYSSISQTDTHISDLKSSSIHRSYSDQISLSSSFESRDVNEPKEMIEHSQNKISKKSQKSNLDKSNKNKIKYPVQKEVKQEAYSESEAENDSRSVTTTSFESSNYKEDDEKPDNQVSKIAKAKSKQLKKRQPSQTKQKTSEIKQNDKKDQQAYSEEEIEQDSISDALSESRSL
ncbi:MAG: hypothetical protein EZS28_031242, partial [Streblomastix strix]